MSEREHREWGLLWEAVFGEPPPITADVTMTAQVLVEHLPAAFPYMPHEVRPQEIRPAKPPRS